MSGGPKAEKTAPTEQEKMLAQVGAEQFNDYLDNGVPRIMQTKEAIRATDAKYADAAMVASGGVEAVGKQAAAQFATPTGGGADAFQRADYDNIMASSKAGALTGAREGVTDLETQGEQKLAAFGRKLGNDTQLSLTQSGRRATEAAVNDTTRKFEMAQTKATALAGLAGAGIGAYGQYKANQRQDQRIKDLATSWRGGK